MNSVCDLTFIISYMQLKIRFINNIFWSKLSIFLFDALLITYKNLSLISNFKLYQNLRLLILSSHNNALVLKGMKNTEIFLVSPFTDDEFQINVISFCYVCQCIMLSYYIISGNYNLKMLTFTY